jgi:hypothetical protein
MVELWLRMAFAGDRQNRGVGDLVQELRKWL